MMFLIYLLPMKQKAGFPRPCGSSSSGAHRRGAAFTTDKQNGQESSFSP